MVAFSSDHFRPQAISYRRAGAPPDQVSDRRRLKPGKPQARTPLDFLRPLCGLCRMQDAWLGLQASIYQSRLERNPQVLVTFMESLLSGLKFNPGQVSTDRCLKLLARFDRVCSTFVKESEHLGHDERDRIIKSIFQVRKNLLGSLRKISLEEGAPELHQCSEELVREVSRLFFLPQHAWGEGQISLITTGLRQDELLQLYLELGFRAVHEDKFEILTPAVSSLVGNLSDQSFASDRSNVGGPGSRSDDNAQFSQQEERIHNLWKTLRVTSALWQDRSWNVHQGVQCLLAIIQGKQQEAREAFFGISDPSFRGTLVALSHCQDRQYFVLEDIWNGLDGLDKVPHHSIAQKAAVHDAFCDAYLHGTRAYRQALLHIMQDISPRKARNLFIPDTYLRRAPSADHLEIACLLHCTGRVESAKAYLAHMMEDRFHHPSVLLSHRIFLQDYIHGMHRLLRLFQEGIPVPECVLEEFLTPKLLLQAMQAKEEGRRFEHPMRYEALKILCAITQWNAQPTVRLLTDLEFALIEMQEDTDMELALLLEAALCFTMVRTRARRDAQQAGVYWTQGVDLLDSYYNPTSMRRLLSFAERLRMEGPHHWMLFEVLVQAALAEGRFPRAKPGILDFHPASLALFELFRSPERDGMVVIMDNEKKSSEANNGEAAAMSDTAHKRARILFHVRVARLFQVLNTE